MTYRLSEAGYLVESLRDVLGGGKWWSFAKKGVKSNRYAPDLQDGMQDGLIVIIGR